MIGNNRVLERSEALESAVAPLMRYKGESKVVGRLRLSQGHVYRVLLLRGCGSFEVRVYDSDDVRRFVSCEYGNLEQFVREWGAI